MEPDRFIGPHGGYQDLEAYKLAEIVHDGTVAFCKRLVDPRSRTTDQMIQAARSGKQNIVEGSMASATSTKSEIFLIGVARASLEELLVDYQDYVRQNELQLWDKASPKAAHIRKLAFNPEKSYATYRTYLEEKTPETAANTMICVIHQASFMLRRLLASLEQKFLNEGGMSEKMYAARQATKRNGQSAGR